MVATNTMATTWKTKSGNSIMIIGPGRMPWISMAASSTAAGAEPGTASVSAGMMAPGMAALLPVSAAIRPSSGTLAEQLLFLAGALRRRIGNPGADVLADAGDDADDGADDAGADDGTLVAPDVVPARQYAVRRVADRLGRPIRITISTSATPKAPTSAGIRAMPPARSDEPKDEALVGVDALLPDHGDEQAEEAGDPALQRVVGRRSSARR